MCLYVHRKDSVERISRKNEAGERSMFCLEWVPEDGNLVYMWWNWPFTGVKIDHPKVRAGFYFQVFIFGCWNVPFFQ